MPNSASPRDENNVPALLACLNTDAIQGENLVTLHISDDNILINQTDTISFTMQPVDPRDENYIGCWFFKGTDGLMYPAVANANGELLVNLL